MQSKMVFKISRSSFYVKEFDVIIHKKSISLHSHINFFAPLYPKSLVNLEVDLGTRYSHQIQGQKHPGKCVVAEPELHSHIKPKCVVQN